jgi:hypothetical protein
VHVGTETLFGGVVGAAVGGEGLAVHSRRIEGASSANRNVWSAASPQAKSEDVTGWSAQMYTAFIGVNHSWPGWNALRSFPH